MSEQIWLSTAQTATRTGRHVITVRRALQAGELDGHQRVKNGSWAVHRDCADAWVSGESCPRHPDR